MCDSMMRNILMDIVPAYCRELGINNFKTLEEWKEKLKNGDPLVRFIPVEADDGRVKSSSVVARNFIESNELKGRFFKSTNDGFDRYLQEGTKLFVFVDDFSGTGEQFSKFINSISIGEYKGKVNFLYSPLAAHVGAINKIHEEYDFVEVRPVDILDKNHEFFYECENGFFRGDNHNTVESAKNFYKEKFSVCSDSSIPFGYGADPLSLTYAFFFSTPNNNIKALYYNEEGVWNRLTFRGEI